MKVTNNTRSPQGFYDAEGKLRWVGVGQTEEIDLTADAKQRADRIDGIVFSESDDPYTSLTDDELLELVEAKTGEKPHARMGRAKLLAKVAD